MTALSFGIFSSKLVLCSDQVGDGACYVEDAVTPAWRQPICRLVVQIGDAGEWGSVLLEKRLETQLPSGRFRWRQEQRLDFRIKIAECGIMGEERSLDLFQSCFENGVRLKFSTDLYERSHDIHAHRDRSRATQNRSRHDRTVFSEGEGTVFSVSAATDWL